MDEDPPPPSQRKGGGGWKREEDDRLEEAEGWGLWGFREITETPLAL